MADTCNWIHKSWCGLVKGAEVQICDNKLRVLLSIRNCVNMDKLHQVILGSLEISYKIIVLTQQTITLKCFDITLAIYFFVHLLCTMYEK